MDNKKKVFAYFHSHWDREWYREFEIFRIRLIRVFDHVLDMLSSNKLPSFYFDGQVVALLDYLKIRPEKEQLVRELIKQKKLYIGPFYCLIDEFLTDGICFRKNLEIGLKISRDFGCTDFLGYFADTFGHSQNIPFILKEFGIDKAIVWRGCNPDLKSEFIFNGINTVNLIRGYFMDIFAQNIPIEDKAKFLKSNLDKIAEKSSDVLLLPIGADHLDIEDDILAQIEMVNTYLDDYEIIPSNLFEYFNSVKFEQEYNEELRDNSSTFILQGAYSARIDLKKLNTECSYKLDLANKLQQKFKLNYDKLIEYAYQLLLKNQAHDSICGCSTDDVHSENIIRYKKILQIAETIIAEVKCKYHQGTVIDLDKKQETLILQNTSNIVPPNSQVITDQVGFDRELLNDTHRIPVTEDFHSQYTYLEETYQTSLDCDLQVTDNTISNNKIKFEVSDNKINLYSNNICYNNIFEFLRCKDLGDSYNFGPDKDDKYDVAQIISSKSLYKGPLQAGLLVKTSFFDVKFTLNKNSSLLNIKIGWNNDIKNQLLQIRFNTNKLVDTVYSEDLNKLICRTFEPQYNIRTNLPNEKGIEVKTNFAPFQRFVWANDIGIITKGLTEYEVSNKALSITLLRATGVISNPNNPARLTPAGPPILTYNSQLLGHNTVELSFGIFKLDTWQDMINEIYPQAIIC